MPGATAGGTTAWGLTTMSAARAQRGMLQHWGLTPLLHGTAAQPGPEGRHRCAAATEPE
jgi:hypothetical protein